MQRASRLWHAYLARGVGVQKRRVDYADAHGQFVGLAARKRIAGAPEVQVLGALFGIEKVAIELASRGVTLLV